MYFLKKENVKSRLFITLYIPGILRPIGKGVIMNVNDMSVDRDVKPLV